jgi:hypothetical protein
VVTRLQQARHKPAPNVPCAACDEDVFHDSIIPKRTAAHPVHRSRY